MAAITITAYLRTPTIPGPVSAAQTISDTGSYLNVTPSRVVSSFQKLGATPRSQKGLSWPRTG